MNFLHEPNVPELSDVYWKSRSLFRPLHPCELARGSNTLFWYPPLSPAPCRRPWISVCPKLKVIDKVAERDFGKNGERRQGQYLKKDRRRLFRGQREANLFLDHSHPF